MCMKIFYLEFRSLHKILQAQINGFIYICRKRWILFPPETGGLKPTRVPYEESSVYSELNFYCPNNLDVFNGMV